MFGELLCRTWNKASLYVCMYVCMYVRLYPITMATDSLSRANKSHARRQLYHNRMFGCQLKLNVYINRCLVQGLSCCQCKGIQISYNPLPQASGKIRLLGLSFTSASYCIFPAALRSQLYYNMYVCMYVQSVYMYIQYTQSSCVPLYSLITCSSV